MRACLLLPPLDPASRKPPSLVPSLPSDGTTPPAVTDAYGHPLTWGTVWAAHTTLLPHAQCDEIGSQPAYDSDDSDEGRPCPCQWHEAMIDEVDNARNNVRRWPGPICGSCWRATCACGHRFADLADAAARLGRGHDGRLVCDACAPPPADAGHVAPLVPE